MLEFNIIFLWLFLIEIISIVTLPISIYLLRRLPDKGYSTAKLFGVLLLTYFSYIIARFKFLPFNWGTIFLSFLLISLLSYFFISYSSLSNEIKVTLNSKEFKKIAIKSEVIFLITFFIFLLIRAYVPDIKGGESSYDLAYLNSLIRTNKLPSIHPWFSQVSLENYYYFGHLFIATLSKFSGISGSYSYNLGLVTIMAFTCLLIFSLAYNLTKKSFYGIIAIFLVAFAGNFFSFIQIVNYINPNIYFYVKFYEPPLHGNFFEKAKNYNWWWPSRIIPWAIHEMPYWTFIWGDLHGHFFAIPLRILLLIFLLNVFNSKFSGFNVFGEDLFEKILGVFSFSLILGFIFPTNIYDFPFLALWVFLTFLFHEILVSKAKEGKVLTLLKIIFLSFIVVLFSLLIYAPVVFQLLQHIQDPSLKYFIEFLPHERNPLLNTGPPNSIRLEIFKTSLYHFILIFSLQILLIFIFIFKLYHDSFVVNIKYRRILFLICLVLYLSLFLSVFINFFPRIEQFYKPLNVSLSIDSLLYDFQLLVILIPIIFSTILFILRKKETSIEMKFTLLLILFGALTVLIAEIINVEGRYVFMNKIYGEIYIVWGLASTYILYFFGRKFLSLKYLPLFSLIIFLLISYGIFPVLTTIQKTNRFTPSYGRKFLTLNGYNWLEREGHKSDYEAIKWLNNNINDVGIILEVPGRDYQYTSRISVFTGLPTVLGWSDHMELHLAISRKNIEKISRDVDQIYDTKNNAIALDLLKKYNVKYIYVGELEKDYKGIYIHGNILEHKEYSKEGLEKFNKYPEFYKLIYNNSGVQIYKVLL